MQASSNMTLIIRKLLASCLFLGALATPAGASIVMSVGGTADDAAVLTHDEALAVVFTLNQNYSNIQITIPVTCTGCDAIAYLTTDFGPGADSSTLLHVGTVDTSGILFDGISLGAGTYALVVWNHSTNVLLWRGSATPVIADPGDDLNGYFMTTDAGTYPPDAFFTPYHSLSPFFSITIGSVATPEPASVGLLLLALVGGAPVVRRVNARRPRC
jgi:hypothetical protein